MTKKKQPTLTVDGVREYLAKTHVLVAECGKKRLFYVPTGRQFYATEKGKKEELVFESTKMAEAVTLWNEYVQEG